VVGAATAKGAIVDSKKATIQPKKRVAKMLSLPIPVFLKKRQFPLLGQL
jgi:hypothetical protein